MRWKNSHRKERFNPDWPRIRHEILERDRFACQWPVTDEFGFTHICAPPENLWALCWYHHSQKTAQESTEQRRMNRERRKEQEWYSRPAYRRTAS